VSRRRDQQPTSDPGGGGGRQIGSCPTLPAIYDWMTVNQIAVFSPQRPMIAAFVANRSTIMLIGFRHSDDQKIRSLSKEHVPKVALSLAIRLMTRRC